jgi:hypothetical protein
MIWQGLSSVSLLKSPEEHCSDTVDKLDYPHFQAKAQKGNDIAKGYLMTKLGLNLHFLNPFLVQSLPITSHYFI